MTMKKINPKRRVDNLSDDEIESCIEGSTDIDLVRELLKSNEAPNGWICSIDFGHEFAEAIEGFIDEASGTNEWDEAWENNAAWGEQIADNINDLLKKK